MRIDKKQKKEGHYNESGEEKPRTKEQKKPVANEKTERTLEEKKRGLDAGLS